MKKRLLALLLTLCMAACLSFAALADDAAPKGSESNPVSDSNELKEAIEAAKDGDTIYLASGTFTTYGGSNDYFINTNNSTCKNITFVGHGTDTIWLVGKQDCVSGQDTNEYYASEYTFGGCESVTFKNMTLTTAGNYNYLGFNHINNTVVENCTINGRTHYWGYQTTVFKNVIFNAPQNDYALWATTGHEFTFDTCTFNISGKGVNVYYDYTDASKEVTINYKNCTVNSSKPNKSVLNIKDSDSVTGVTAFKVNFSGTNIVTGLNPNGTTCSRLFQVQYTSENGTASTKCATTVTIDGTTVWENGKMVSHAIDCTNDKYTDGYKDNAFNTTGATAWQLNDDKTAYTCTATKVCKYCGYTETEEKTGYVVTYKESIDGKVLKQSEVLVAGSKTPAFGDNPTRSGYVFAGWDKEIAPTVTAMATYTAQWKKQYTVTYTDGANGTAFGNQTFTVTEGDATPTYTVPTRSGYTFTGWSPAVSATVTGDVTYTAQWSADAAPTPAATATPKPTAAPTAAPTATPAATATVPQTGDSFPLIALIALMVVAAAGFGTVLYRKKKQ